MASPNPGGSPKPKDNWVWLRVGLAFAVAWIVYLRFFGPEGQSDPMSPPDLVATGSTLAADYGWNARGLGGETVEFSDFKGKVVLLNIWATWCPPCVAEMPSIARLAKDPRLQGKPIEIVCVSIDQDLEKVRRFVDGKDWPMTIVHVDDLPDVFLTDAIPATFLIAPDGRVDASHLGSAEWDDEDVVTRLLKLAGEARPAS